MARSFNGTTAVMDCGGTSGSLSVAANTSIAVSAWVNVSAFPTAGNQATVLSKGYDGTITAYELIITSTLLQFDSFNSGNNPNANWTYTGWSTGAWVHIYGDYDGSNWHIAFNGVIKATAASITGPQHNLVRFGIGAVDVTGAFGNFFNGKIADVAVWKVALSATEIAALAAGIRPPNIRPLSIIGYWPIDGIQSPEPDLSGFAHNGTLTATALAFGPPIAPFTPRWPVWWLLPPPPVFTLMPQIVM